jgi:O-antigen/teichoic acid export membrane protein
MSVAAIGATVDLGARAAAVAAPAALSPRTRALLHGPIVPTLLRMAWPNVLVMVAQAATGLIETWFVSKLGTDALAGMALVFPGVMLMQMISAGAMGGGISSAIARALGRGQRDQADALAMHAVVINVALGAVFSAVMLGFARPIYRALGGAGGELDAAVAYSNVVFAGSVLLWLLNGLASIIRGTGNMLVLALVICVGVVVLVPLSPLLIFGIGPFPALGIAGGGVALVLFYAAGTAVLAWYILSGRNIARLRPARPRWPLFREILGVGAVAAVTSVQTNVIIALATALVTTAAGPAAAAGYGTSASRRAIGGARRYQCRCRGAQARAPHRLCRRGARVCNHRGHRRRCSDLAARLDRAVQRRSTRDRNWDRLFARGRPQLRVFRARACALFRVARRGTAVLAAVGGLPAHVRRHRRGMAGAALDRLAQLAVRRAGVRPRAARAHIGRGYRRRRVVSQSAAADHSAHGLIARKRARRTHAVPARAYAHLKLMKPAERAPTKQRAARSASVVSIDIPPHATRGEYAP